MTLVKLLTIAILLSCVSCLASAGAEHVPAGGLGGGEGGAPQRAVPGMETSEKPRSQPDAIPLGTEFPPGELERRKRQMEQEWLPPTAGPQTDQGR
jgi:hypothetical protein